MPYPVVKVEIGFNDGPYVASPSWTDITSYVREISIRRGRSDEFQDFDAGTASLTLDNRSRIFDPTNTAGTYYGKLLPRKQIKITATNNGTVYPVYRGYITGWPMSITEAGFDATVTLECYDALGLLANEELPDDLADYYIRSLSPRHYWPLTDPIDPQNYSSQRLQDFGNSPQPLSCAAGLRTSNAPGLASGLANCSNSVSQSDYAAGWSFTSIARTAPAGIVATFWKLPGADSVQWCSYDAGFTVNVFYNLGTNTFTLDTYDGTNRRNYTGLATYLDMTQPHFVEIATRKPRGILSTDVGVSIDGQPISMVYQSTTANTTASIEDCEIGVGRTQQFSIFADPPSGYIYQIDSTQANTIQQLSLGYVTESSGARFDRLIGYTDFPTALTSKSVNLVATVTEISDGGPTVVSELQILSDSEGGSLYVSKSGVITLTARGDYATGRSITPQATFGSGGIGIGTNIDYHLTADNLRNELTMGFSGNGSIDVKDTTSINEVGTCGGSWPTQLSTQSDAQALGTLLLGFSSSPKLVISPYEVNVEASTASWDTVLSLELLDRIVLNIPQKTGANTTAVQLLQSIEHKITPSQWSTTVNGSVRYTNIFIIGTSLIGGTDLLS
jgi:hypothetical protein